MIVISTIFLFLWKGGKIGVKYYPNPILRPYLESPHQGESFRTPVLGEELRIYFWLFIVFSNIYLACEPKKVIAGG